LTIGSQAWLSTSCMTTALEFFISPECPFVYRTLQPRYFRLNPHLDLRHTGSRSQGERLPSGSLHLPESAVTRDFTATTFVVRNDVLFLLWHNKIETWLPPGGHIHAGELPEQAAVREVREESGLEVRLIKAGDGGQTWGPVKVLHQPVCILLEDIEPGHQHIDLIYFAVTVDEAPAEVNLREAREGRWVDKATLAQAQDIHEDIRLLGLRALAAAEGR